MKWTTTSVRAVFNKVGKGLISGQNRKLVVIYIQIMQLIPTPFNGWRHQPALFILLSANLVIISRKPVGRSLATLITKLKYLGSVN